MVNSTPQPVYPRERDPVLIIEIQDTEFVGPIKTDQNCISWYIGLLKDRNLTHLLNPERNSPINGYKSPIKILKRLLENWGGN
jgi:hypothetical protein